MDIVHDYSRPPRISVSMQPALHLLSYEVKIVSVSKHHLPDLTHSLLQLTLKLLEKDSSYRQNSFYSFTETSTDYSLLLDCQLFEELENSPGFSNVNVARGKWRPFVIEVGAFGSLSGISKIAASVIGPLADVGVSVFCLSSNQEDYVMVEDDNLKCALQCLCNRFKLVCDSDRQSDIELVEEILLNSIPYYVNRTFLPKLPVTKNTRPIVHPFSCSSIKFYVCSVLPSTLQSIAQPLLQTMFFNARSQSSVEESFFSFSIIGDDVSLIVDSRDIGRFPMDSVYSSETYWRVFTIGSGPLGFDECGIVAQMSSPLANEEISTFYICTYKNDHILIPESNMVKALKLLKTYVSSDYNELTSHNEQS